MSALVRFWCWLRRHPLVDDVCLAGCRRREARRRAHYREALKALRSVQ